MNLIIHAAQLAAKAHAGQKRKWSNEDYVCHPARVAARVMRLPHVTEEVVCAAWLHDVIEDTGQVIPIEFSGKVFDLVFELTNPSKEHPALSRTERKAMDREHLRTVSRWAKVIKLIDRIDNVNDMKGASPDFAELYRHESRLLNAALFVPGNEIIEDLRCELQGVINENYHYFEG